MGLDMYLNKKTYVQNWNHQNLEEQHKVIVHRGGKVRKDIKPERICNIEEHVAYWRKANAIHKWFVDNVQGGNDDCGNYYVEKEQLQTLLDLCKQVVSSLETIEGDVVISHSKALGDAEWTINTKKGKVVAQQGLAASMLPTEEGFFFGGTHYDEFYLDDLKHTIEQLEPLMKEDGDFYYNSSW